MTIKEEKTMSEQSPQPEEIMNTATDMRTNFVDATKLVEKSKSDQESRKQEYKASKELLGTLSMSDVEIGKNLGENIENNGVKFNLSSDRPEYIHETTKKIGSAFVPTLKAVSTEAARKSVDAQIKLDEANTQQSEALGEATVHYEQNKDTYQDQAVLEAQAGGADVNFSKQQEPPKAA